MCPIELTAAARRYHQHWGIEFKFKLVLIELVWMRLLRRERGMMMIQRLGGELTQAGAELVTMILILEHPGNNLTGLEPVIRSQGAPSHNTSRRQTAQRIGKSSP